MYQQVPIESTVKKSPQERFGPLMKLEHVSVHLGGVRAPALKSFLKLPSLRSLEVDMRFRGMPADDQLTTESYQSNIQTLAIVGYNKYRFKSVIWLSHQCPALRELFLRMDIGAALIFVKAFSYLFRSGMLTSFQIAVVGSLHYNVEVVSPGPRPPGIFKVLYDDLLEAERGFASHGTSEVFATCPGIGRIRMRELSDEENKACANAKRRPSRKPECLVLRQNLEAGCQDRLQHG